MNQIYSGGEPWHSASNCRYRVAKNDNPPTEQMTVSRPWPRVLLGVPGPVAFRCPVSRRQAGRAAGQDTGGIFVAALLAIVILVPLDNNRSANGTAYVTAAGEMRMLSQRLARPSSLALRGTPAAFAAIEANPRNLPTCSSG